MSIESPEPQSPEIARTAAPLWIARTLLVLLILVAFGRIVAFGPVNWDDQETIFANAALLPPGIDAFVGTWTRPHLSLWIPATHSLWAALAMIGETTTGGRPSLSPVPFRVASLLLHAASTLLTFEIARRLWQRSTWPATVAAVVFAVHPVQVESVAWISGQKDVLAGCLTLAAILAALRSRVFAANANANADPRDLGWHPFVAYAFAVAAMLAKPQAVVVVALVPLVLVIAGASWRVAALFTWPLLVPAVIVALVARLVQPATLVDAGPLWGRTLVTIDALGFYVRQLLWPATLAVDYGRPPASVVDVRHVLCAVATLLPVVGVAIVLRRRVPGVAYGLAIATVAVAPVLGLIPFEFQQYATVGDHYLYTAMLGVGLAAASIASRLSTRIVVPLTVLLAGVLGARSFTQAGVWRDTTTLFTHNLKVTPTSLAAGRVLAAETRDDRSKIAAYRRVLASHPGDAITWFNLANSLARAGELDDAGQAFARAIALRPTHAGMRHNHAIILIRRGELDAAEAELREAVTLDPTSRASADALAKLQAMRASTP